MQIIPNWVFFTRPREKRFKIPASGQNFLDPYSKKGPTDENVGISNLIVIVKFSFIKISNPPPLFWKKYEIHQFC